MVQLLCNFIVQEFWPGLAFLHIVNEHNIFFYLPLLYRLLKHTPGFSFTPRSRENLPAGFPDSIPGIPFFLEDYEFPDVKGCGERVNHVALAVEYYKIKEEGVATS